MYRFYLVVMVILWGIGQVRAQGDFPLLAVVNGALFRLVAGELQPFNACNPPERIDSELIIAPNHDDFAMLTQPAEVTALIEKEGGLAGGELPRNLWTCSQSGNRPLSQWATQPANTYFSGGNVPSVQRSLPSWSLDGTQLAWLETDFEQFWAQVLTVETGQTFMFALEEVAQQFGVPRSPSFFWGAGALLVISETLIPNTSALETSIVAYTADGVFIGRVPLSITGDGGDFISENRLIRVQSGVFIHTRFFDGDILLTHPLTGQAFVVPDGRVVRQVVNGVTANALIYELLDGYNATWVTANQTDLNGQPYGFFGYGWGKIALSPDGQQLALWQDENDLMLWQSGETGIIPNTRLSLTDTQSLAWGATELVLENAPLLTVQCPNALSSYFRIGQSARLSATTTANNVRLFPTTNGSLVGKIQPAESFTVLAGPVCANGYAWYYVQTSTLKGWTVQGNASVYFIEQ